MRLQRYLSQTGAASRRKAEEMILAGRISVNGKTVRELGTKVVPGKDSVSVDGKKMRAEVKCLYVFHKPEKVVSTLLDPENRPCIGDFVRKLPARVYPIGRLDFDVSGILLLTNDGELMEHLLHPRYKVPRVYWARVFRKPTRDSLRRLCYGIQLEDGYGKASDAKELKESDRVKQLLGSNRSKDESGLIELTVLEGRNHFVKRLLEAVGHPVQKLCRVRFGDYTLGGMPPGSIREVKPLPQFDNPR